MPRYAGQMPPKDPWRVIKTYVDLVETNAAFVRGEIAQSPYHLAPLDPDSTTLVQGLLEMHRRGLMTVSGQSASCTPQVEQKPYVQFYIQKTPEAKRLLDALFASSDLAVFAWDNATNEAFTEVEMPYNVTRDRKDSKAAWRLFTNLHSGCSTGYAFERYPNIARVLKNTYEVAVCGREYCQGDVESRIISICDSVGLV